MDLSKFTERSRGFIQAAQTIATRDSHQRLTPEHILKALLDDDQGLASNLINAAGGDAGRVAQAVEMSLAKLPKVTGDAAQVYLDNTTQKVLVEAESLAKKAGDSFVPVEHLLMALAMVRSGAKDALDAGAVSAQNLNAAINDIRKGRTADTASGAAGPDTGPAGDDLPEGWQRYGEGGRALFAALADGAGPRLWRPLADEDVAARLGEIEICYDNVRWVDRRAEPVRADDPHVANYHGRLGFDLVGRYREGEDVNEVFGYTFVSPDEYHYLFGAATDEVLDDSCPTEWIGTRVTTGLGGDRRIRVVPDEQEAVETALGLARAGDLVMIFGDVIKRCWKQIVYFKPGEGAGPEVGVAAADDGFALLLPQDIVVDARRLGALRDWCQGFLFGIGLGGEQLLQQGSAQMRDLLRDIAEITRLATDDVDNSSENQSALIEIEEYLRVGVLLLREERQDVKATHDSE